MNIFKVTEDYSVCGQISATDVAEIKAAGFKSIMCNRPDDEQFRQPKAESIKKAAEEHGLKFFFLPFGKAGIDEDLLNNFREVVDGDNGPVFAYCRTGNRCGMLWNALQR